MWIEHNMNIGNEDPIARNPKDVDDPAETLQSIPVSRRGEAPVITSDAATLPMHPAPSTGELIASVLRFKRTILAIFLLVCAPIILMIWTQVTPKYVAWAELRIRPYIPFLVFKTEDTGVVPFYDSFVNTQVSVMRSPTVLERVLEQSVIRETQWYKNPPQSLKQRLLGNAPDSPMERLRDNLLVRPRHRTEITDVQFTDINRQEAVLIANEILAQYLAYSDEKSEEAKDYIDNALEDQYRSLEMEITEHEMILADMRKLLETQDPEELVSRNKFDMDWTQNRLQELRQNIALWEWDRARLEGMITRDMTGDSNNVPFTFQDGMEEQLSHERDVLWEKYTFELRSMQQQVARLGACLGTHVLQETGAGEEAGFSQIRVHFRKLQQSMVVLDRDRAKLESLVKMDVAEDGHDIGSVSYGHKDHDDAVWRKLAFDLNSIRKGIGQLSLALSIQFPQESVVRKGGNSAEVHACLSDLSESVELLRRDCKRLEDLSTRAVMVGSHEVAVASDLGMDKQPKYYADEEWRKLDTKLRTLQNDILNSPLGPGHPAMARLTRNVEFAQESLSQREAQLDELWPSLLGDVAGVPVARGSDYEAVLKSRENQLERAKQEEQLLARKLEKQQAEFESLFQTTESFNRELAELEHKRRLFKTVRQRRDQKAMERNAIGKIEQLTEAFASSKPTQDRRAIFTIMTLFMGLGMGGGVAFLRANVDQTISNPKQVPRSMQAPFLGCIPIVPKGQFLDYEVSPAMIQSVRTVRTALLTRLNTRTCSRIVLTSATEATGKSSFIAILGKSIAQTGMKVLMIDADLHKRSLSKRWGVLDYTGFMEFLESGTYTEQEHVVPTVTSNLSIMPAGRPPQELESLEVISNGSFQACMDILAQQYDMVLLDSPPLLPVADATILAGQIDGVIMVERENISQRTKVTEALARLSATGGRLLGTVFVASFRHGRGCGDNECNG